MCDFSRLVIRYAHGPLAGQGKTFRFCTARPFPTVNHHSWLHSVLTMSLNISAFLGKKTDGLEARFIEAFANLGFDVQLHPDLTLTKSSAEQVLYLRVTKTPVEFLRMEPAIPLLIAFEFGVQKRGKKEPRSMLWPPRGVGNYSYTTISRTAAGRSESTAAMQILSMAILAKESEGYFYADGEDVASPGEVAFNQAVQEQNRFNRTNFDAYAYRFESWPPVDGIAPFAWPPKIVPPKSLTQKMPKRRFRFRYKFSWLQFPGILLVSYFILATLLYS